ncbi:molybdate ABC transporter substrate-binding protein [Paenibacillus athensensis]|uniref:Molybdate ABC transporter substrate-binding protein n=1 Tax=Paenibacillus athensensis TaxID=1967502 RepID=A0A4Y8PR18_9BACL|nr:molybdate ABC transporter substrate-binding protein [Paenibacillus athensensis]MCD1257257.1 molybdate ABC transporter substrate-binding protein [Paenibacillus athensensis]
MMLNVKSMKNYALIALLGAALVVVAGCGASPEASPAVSPSPSAAAATGVPVEAVELTVSAAASLTDALKEVQTAYEAAHAGIKLSFNFGASGALQQQIEQGAPADLFLSAAAKNMKALVDKQLIDPALQTALLANSLVVVVPADARTAPVALSDLTKPEVKAVAIGIPESVPAGSYAKEALTKAGLWDALQAKTVQGKDVRQVLQYVETGNADAGFVYKTDALTSAKVRVAFAADPATYAPIVYPFGIVKATKHPQEAADLYAYLQSQAALDVFQKYGFSVSH